MSWIKSFQELRDHPKTKRAARLLGMEKIHLVGHLHGLWWWAASYAEDGSLAGYDATDIAEAAEWQGDPDLFIKALVDCGINGNAGFLEYDPSGHLLIHDWDEYAGSLVQRRTTERERQREKRATASLTATDVDATLAQHTANAEPTSGVCTHLEAEADKKQKRGRADSSARRVAPADVPDDFKSFDAILRPFDGYDPSGNFFDTITERYTHLPLKEEAVKATEWLRANKKRKCTTVFLLKWLSNAAAGYAARGRASPNNGRTDRPGPDLPNYGGKLPWEVAT